MTIKQLYEYLETNLLAVSGVNGVTWYNSDEDKLEQMNAMQNGRVA